MEMQGRGTQGNASQFSLYGYAEHRDRLSAPPLYEKDKMDIYTCCEEEGRSTVEEDYYYKELRVAHRKMVKQLSEKRRQAYILYFYRGMSYASIADRLSVSERSVGSHLQRAFRAVRLGVDGIYRYKAG